MKKYVMLISVLFLNSCAFEPNNTFTRFWNNGFFYNMELADSRQKKIQEKRDEYYRKENTESQRLRKRNEIFCENKTDKVYSNNMRNIINNVEYWDFYYLCMKEKGTPVIDYDIKSDKYYEVLRS